VLDGLSTSAAASSERIAAHGAVRATTLGTTNTSGCTA
jgi:hypothetical protein